MIYEGKTANRLTLTPGAMDTIEYRNFRGFCVDIINYGAGNVYINWKGAATVGGSESILIQPMVSYEVRTSLSSASDSAVDVIELNIVSDDAATVQVVRTVR